MNSVVLIPSLKPDEKLTQYVHRLTDAGFDKIMVVNDGSPAEYDEIFNELDKLPSCTVLRHEINKGKGRALKTGMKYYLEHFKGCDGIVTGDADGQHSLEDTLNLANILSERQDALLLGSRDFSDPNVPFRSRAGNRITSVVFKLFYGTWLRDTQTGLRAIPDTLVELFSESEGERYEYEMNMLMECTERNIPMIEEPIQTIYIDDNSGSHFNALRDSTRIYWLLLKNFIMYLCSSVLSFVVEFLLLLLIDKTLGAVLAQGEGFWGKVLRILLEGGVARGCSSVFNFFLNKIFVFQKKGDTGRSFGKYVALVIGNFAVTYLITGIISSIFGYEPYWVAPIITMIMFVVCYTLQKIWVFKKAPTEHDLDVSELFNKDENN